MKKVLGTNTIGYPEIRNFCGLPFRKYEFRKKQNLFKLPAYIFDKLQGEPLAFFWNAFYDMDLHKVEMYHFFNGISFGNRPWVTTFETMLPRWGDVNHRLEKRGISLLAGDACKRIIALSDCTYGIQLDLIHSTWPEYARKIEDKMIVLHPPQKLQINSLDEKPVNEKVTFAFVGAAFFRKGGKEVLFAFDHLYRHGIRNWKLNIVSALEFDDYASGATQADLDEVKRIIGLYPDHISHFSGLPNAEVMLIFKNSDIGLLPSYADTYGYSVLEAQAAGCPVITTNIRAFPEINDSQCGWMIEVPCKNHGIALVETQQQREVFSGVLRDGLIETLRQILQNPAEIKAKGKIAYRKISENHSVEDRTNTLESLYDQILAGKI
jgi:glycosyltransferase involved in cell wall biosynthesis